MEKVLSILRSQLSEEQFRIDHPRMSLEEFFLDVVNKAQAESVETYGARSGGQIADYLSSGERSEDELRARQQLLDSLTGPEEKAQSEPEIPESAPETAVNTEKLNDLSDDLLKTKEDRSGKPEEPEEDLSEANAKLNDMLSGSLRKD